MMGNLKLLCNFIEKYLGTVCFGNDQFALILGYWDLVQVNIMIKMVYYIEGLNHNLFLVGQFCDADLEVALWKYTCFVRDLQGNDLLTGNLGSDLYTISLQETSSPTPIYFLAKASPTQAWLWHRRLSHLNFDTINLLFQEGYCEWITKVEICQGSTVFFIVPKSSSPSNNSQQHDTHPSANAQSRTSSITPTTTVTAEENNTDIQAKIQVENAQIDENKFYNILSTPVHEEAELSTCYVDPSNMHTLVSKHVIYNFLYGLCANQYITQTSNKGKLSIKITYPNNEKINFLGLDLFLQDIQCFELKKGSYDLSWKPCQGDSSKLNQPDHKSVLMESEVQTTVLQPHSSTTKTYSKHQDLRIKKAQELKTKTSATLIFKIFPKNIKIIKTKIAKGDC
ncbi:integrase, catalytic region, zinc finger, CCHC-type containing protein [Tanacetum coccineum]